MFHERLTYYIELLNCTGKEFSERSGISEATVSRYRSGTRTPRANSDDMKKLCRGICSIAAQKGIDLSYSAVLGELNSLSEGKAFDFDSLQTKFNMLCSVFTVNLADMSKKLKYDPSYMSRVKSGKRRPADPEKFASDIAVYFSKYYDSENHKKIIAEIMGLKTEQIKTADRYVSKLTNWLINSEDDKKPENPLTLY